jgi:hypothetical protein
LQFQKLCKAPLTVSVNQLANAPWAVSEVVDLVGGQFLAFTISILEKSGQNTQHKWQQKVL